MFMFLQNSYLIHSLTKPTKSKIAMATVLEKLKISQLAKGNKVLPTSRLNTTSTCPHPVPEEPSTRIPSYLLFSVLPSGHFPSNHKPPKLPIFPVSSYFFPLRPKYLPQDPQPMSSHPHNITKKLIAMYIFMYVQCVLNRVFVSTNKAQYIFFTLTIFML
jgi:hypothetical protein